MKTTIFSFAFVTLFVLCFTGAFGQSTVTVGLTSTIQNINLGTYGNHTISQINLACSASSTIYRWEVDGNWQTTSGQRNSFTTPSGFISIVPIPGTAGCGDGSVSVSGTGSGGGGAALKTVGPPQQTPFSFNVGFSQLGYSKSLAITPSSAGISYALLNTSPTYNYSWTLTPSIPGTYIDAAILFTPSTNQSGMITSELTENSNLDYTGELAANITVTGSPSCTGIVQSMITISSPSDSQSDGAPGGANGGDGFGSNGYCTSFTDLDGDFEVFCYYARTAISFYPNPAKNELNFAVRSSASNATVSMYNQVGGLVMTKENVSSDFTLDTSGLPEGMYFVKIQGGGKTTTERVLVKK